MTTTKRNTLPARIANRARVIARRESPTGTVAPAYVIRAAIECGAGRPGAPLTRALQGQKAYGVVLSAEDWRESIAAMIAGEHLYTSGGRWVITESAERPAA